MLNYTLGTIEASEALIKDLYIDLRANVVLARTMTAACRKHIADAGIQKYLIFERADDAHTRVYGNGWEETYDGAYWSLDNFLKIW